MMGRAGRTVLAAAGLAALGLAAPARAGEQDLQQELERTREQVQQLLRRVEDLEKKAPPPAAPSDLSKAVDDYMKDHPAAAGGFNVTAPGSRSLKFSGQILFWWERWDGTYRVNDPAGADVNDIGWLRASLQADAEITDDLRARIEIRDARTFGQEPSTTAQLQTPGTGLDLKQGWFEADDLFGCRTKMRAGRQVLKYGDERLVGDLDWATYGRSFDAVVFSHVYDRTKTKIDLFGSRVNERATGVYVPGVDNDDRNFFGIYAETPKALHHSDLDLYALFLQDLQAAGGEVAGQSGNTGVWVPGFRVAGAREALDWGTEWAVQYGSLAGDNLLGWAGHAHLGYTLKDAKWSPRLAVEWDWATGDEDPGDGDRRSFQTLFPTNHKYYGIMDLMAWQNMQAFSVQARVKPGEKWTLDAALWRFHLDNSADAWYAASGGVIRPGRSSASAYLGTEFDLILTWKANDHLRVAFGGGQFFDGSFVRDTGGGGDSLWCYLRMTVDF